MTTAKSPERRERAVLVEGVEFEVIAAESDA
jgi:hypothetical protein